MYNIEVVEGVVVLLIDVLVFMWVGWIYIEFGGLGILVLYVDMMLIIIFLICVLLILGKLSKWLFCVKCLIFLFIWKILILLFLCLNVFKFLK